MDAERLLVSKAIQQEDLLPVIDARITPEFFLNEETQEVFVWMLDYWKRYSATPTAQALKANFPTYKLKDPKEPYDFLIETLRDRRRYAIVYDGVARAGEALDDDDSETALTELTTAISQTNTEIAALQDGDLNEDLESRYEHYEELETMSGQIQGIPTGFMTFDYALNGLQPENLVTFVAPPKAGKSTMLMRMAITAHEHGRMPLFISFEMSKEEQSSRYDAMRARISHHNLTNGKLSEKEKKRLRKSMKALSSAHPFILSTDVASTTTTSGVAAKIEQHQPDIAFIDGVYLMDDENGEPKGSPQALTNLTRSLKRLAQSKKIPIVMSTQALTWKMSKNRVSADSTGYSSSFLQDSDSMLSIEPTDTEDRRIARLLMARNAAQAEVQISWDWETMTFEERSMDDDEDDHD